MHLRINRKQKLLQYPKGIFPLQINRKQNALKYIMDNVKQMSFFIHTFDPAKAAMTRTIPLLGLRGASSARINHPSVPFEYTSKYTALSFPFSKAILHGTASPEN